MVRAGVFIGALVLFPAVASAQQPCTSDARQVVDQVYRHILERPAGDPRSNVLVERLQSGSATPRDIVRQVAASSEHTQRFLSGTRDSAVTTLYRHLLNRQPDPDGLRAHAEGIGAFGVAAVVENMVSSAEYQQSTGDNGVPGPSGVRYCGPGTAQSAQPAPGGNRFQAMDANRDGVIARREWTGTREAFNVQDWNADGVLSGEEVRPGARRRAGGAVNRSADPNGNLFDWTAADFAEIDFNRDGRIASSEWNYDPGTFRSVDRNRDGILTRAEFLAGDSGTDRFTSLDANRNGRIERSEWDGTRTEFDRLDTNRNNLLSQTEVVGTGSVGTAGVATNAFGSIDVNRDGRITIDEWNGNRRSFDRQDTNGDGVIMPREFTGAPPPAIGR